MSNEKSIDINLPCKYILPMYNDLENIGSVYFATLGCPKNEVDTQVWLDYLTDSGLRVVENPEEADFLFANTCAFIEDARLESKETIKRLLRIKEFAPSKRVYITGCWAQLEKGKLLDMFPSVDGILGNLDIATSCNFFLKKIKSNERILHIPSSISLDYPLVKNLPNSFPYAYLKIAEGCNNSCSYCILPYIRGKYRSVPENVIIAQAKLLLEHGFRELVLVAQETTQYGKDLDEKTDITTLLQKLNDLEGDFIIRLMYTNPLRVDKRLVRAISELPKVVKYIDIPLQHYDDTILLSMRRGYSSHNIEQLIDMIKNIDEEIVLRTTFMVGFPGEDDVKFDRLLKFIERGNFLHIGVFKYSPETNTMAASMPQRVPDEIASLRKELLEMVHNDILIDRNEEYVGKIVNALIDNEAVREGFFVARMKQDAPQVDRHIKVRGDMEVGKWSKVEIVKALANNFLGVKEEIWRRI